MINEKKKIIIMKKVTKMKYMKRMRVMSFIMIVTIRIIMQMIKLMKLAKTLKTQIRQRLIVTMMKMKMPIINRVNNRENDV